MNLMLFPIIYIFLSELFANNNKKVLCISFLSGFSKIETPRNHCFLVNYHNFVMSNRMGIINISRNSHV